MNSQGSIATSGGDVVPLLMLVGVATLLVGHIWWHFRRSRALLRQWAARQGIRLIRCEYRWLARGPFSWTTSKGQAVYRIMAELPDGQTNRGWARVGGWLIGLLSSRVDVRWDQRQAGFPVVFPAPLKDDEVVRP